MLLSVGMIVKNEEKYLERCLSALKPVVDEIGGEIVIVDTGSTDKTVEIAKKFTDKVLYFEWINDFSAARNCSLENSCGEWFMFIDADEILKDGDELVKFFKSGEYRKFKTATFVVRNYDSTELRTYSNFRVHRLVKVTPETKFINPIHEMLHPISKPIKHLNVVADHYGYVYETQEQKNAKSERNIKLLLKELEKYEQPDPLLLLQIAQSYAQYDDEKAAEYCDLCIKRSQEVRSIILFAAYAEKASLYVDSMTYDKAASVCDEYFQFKNRLTNDETPFDVDLHGMFAISLHGLKHYPQAYEEYVTFFELYKLIENGTYNIDDDMPSVLYVATPSKIPDLKGNFMDVCIRLKKYAELAPYLDELLENPEKWSVNDKMHALVAVIGCHRDPSPVLRQIKDISQLSAHCAQIYPQLLEVCDQFAVTVPEQPQDVKALLTVYENAMKAEIEYEIPVVSLFAKYGQIAAEFLEQNPATEDMQITSAAIADNICKNRAAGNYSACHEELNRLTNLYPKVKYIALSVKNTLKKDRSSEMDMLAAQVKSTIRGLCSSGDLNQAAALLKELEQIIPNDKELPSLRSMIENKK